MGKGYLILPLFLFSALILSCSRGAPSEVQPSQTAAPGPVTPSAGTEAGFPGWDKVLEISRKEARVTLYGAPGLFVASVREELIPLFQKKFGLTLDITTLRGADMGARIEAEQRAGVYVADLYFSGPDTGLRLYKEGLLQAVKLPEIELNPPALWKFKPQGFYDKEGAMVLARFTSGDVDAAINVNLVSPSEEPKTYEDVLHPRWKNKIVMPDLTGSGPGGPWAAAVVEGGYLGGVEYLKKLAQQNPVLIREDRLLVEQVVYGKYPLGLQGSGNWVLEMKKLGAAIKPLSLGDWVTPGLHPVTMLKNAPHRNAALVFMNWAMSKEGQEFIGKGGMVWSQRWDVEEAWLPEELRWKPTWKQGVNVYIRTEADLEKGNERRELLRKIFLSPQR